MKKNILFIIFGTIFLLLILTMTYFSLTGDTPDKVVKCYDRYSNEIIGQTCIDYGYHPTESDKRDAMISVIIAFILSEIVIFFMARSFEE